MQGYAKIRGHFVLNFLTLEVAFWLDWLDTDTLYDKSRL